MKTNSKKAADFATVLHAMEKAGKIIDLREQVKFVLIPAQYIDGKCIERAWSYVCDFQYRYPGAELRTVDVKGLKTQEYVSKRKAMLFFHGIRIEEV